MIKGTVGIGDETDIHRGEIRGKLLEWPWTNPLHVWAPKKGVKLLDVEPGVLWTDHQ